MLCTVLVVGDTVGEQGDHGSYPHRTRAHDDSRHCTSKDNNMDHYKREWWCGGVIGTYF